MSPLLERLGVELPVAQAGMGGGLARHELAAAVSEAGGLGTIGLMGADALEAELRAARGLTGRPVAVNLIVPLATRAHWTAAGAADVVVTHWGSPRRRTAAPWIHQCGSVEEARAAHAAGADGVIAQGREAGGHTRAELPALEVLARIKAALPAGYPVLLAGGVADADDLRTALDQVAEAAVLGTRFLMTEESRAHPGYRQRLVEGGTTILTELWGFGWPGPHRVLPNAATERWLARDRRGPAPARLVNALTGRMPLPTQVVLQNARLPFLTPHAATDDRPESALDHAPLYAGETVARIDDVRPAADVVRGLA
ncbi:MAG TPA: nitronate monooxygenase [Thermoleophilaceae bacterium]|nr:nitronate monooxygenase [Thermoleophilaceae bacterium]